MKTDAGRERNSPWSQSGCGYLVSGCGYCEGSEGTGSQGATCDGVG